MSTLPAESDKRSAGDPPANYHRTDHNELRWVHADTGLEVALVRDSRPSGRRLTRASAARPDDDCWILEVRPDEYAEIYRRLDGDKQGALASAHEWMADHPEGLLGE